LFSQTEKDKITRNFKTSGDTYIFQSIVKLLWGSHTLIGAFSVLFLLLGIDTLFSAYHLKNPHEFVMYFFASNLMILVSAVGIIHAGIRVHSRIKSSGQRTSGGISP